MAKEGTKNFVLRIDAQTFEALERWAADEFRSTNGQLQWIIDEALVRAGRKKRDSSLRSE
jgi:hypothetical protein